MRLKTLVPWCQSSTNPGSALYIMIFENGVFHVNTYVENNILCDTTLWKWLMIGMA